MLLHLHWYLNKYGGWKHYIQQLYGIFNSIYVNDFGLNHTQKPPSLHLVLLLHMLFPSQFLIQIKQCVLEVLVIILGLLVKRFMLSHFCSVLWVATIICFNSIHQILPTLLPSFQTFKHFSMDSLNPHMVIFRFFHGICSFAQFSLITDMILIWVLHNKVNRELDPLPLFKPLLPVFKLFITTSIHTNFIIHSL